MTCLVKSTGVMTFYGYFVALRLTGDASVCSVKLSGSKVCPAPSKDQVMPCVRNVWNGHRKTNLKLNKKTRSSQLSYRMQGLFVSDIYRCFTCDVSVSRSDVTTC